MRAGLGRWGRLADFWLRSGRYEADCPQRPSPYPHGGSPWSENDFLAHGTARPSTQRTLIPCGVRSSVLTLLTLRVNIGTRAYQKLQVQRHASPL